MKVAMKYSYSIIQKIKSTYTRCYSEMFFRLDQNPSIPFLPRTAPSMVLGPIHHILMDFSASSPIKGN